VGLDIRLPIGLLFSVLGILLLIYGLVNPSEAQKSLGININLEWGAVMLGFGVVMLLLGWRGHTSSRRNARSEGPTDDRPVGHS